MDGLVDCWIGEGDGHLIVGGSGFEIWLFGIFLEFGFWSLEFSLGRP